MVRLDVYGITTIDRGELQALGIAEPAGWVVHSGAALCRFNEDWLDVARRVDSVRRLNK